MVIAVLTIELYIPGSSSLKEKRMVLRSLKDRIGKKFNVSIAEVDYLDKWQRSRIGVVQVGSDYRYIEKNMQQIFNLIDGNGMAQIVDHTLEFI
ncbi:MAG: DUF503 domain-containing protein [Calditrichaeota bacterium]|nr:MAG: DUF503 domain-containing protein [Calditrichota bacterium]